MNMKNSPRRAHDESHELPPPVTILFVEDHKLVADAIGDRLRLEGWRVESFADGLSGLKEVEGDGHFDLLLLDEDLPGLSGLEIVSRARDLPHRKLTPIIVISATNCQAAARSAGADVFLRKPQDIFSLVSTVSRLLEFKPVT